jgi:hypothetical protein
MGLIDDIEFTLQETEKSHFKGFLKTGWNPALSLESIFFQIKLQMKVQELILGMIVEKRSLDLLEKPLDGIPKFCKIFSFFSNQ